MNFGGELGALMRSWILVLDCGGDFDGDGSNSSSSYNHSHSMFSTTSINSGANDKSGESTISHADDETVESLEKDLSERIPRPRLEPGKVTLSLFSIAMSPTSAQRSTTFSLASPSFLLPRCRHV